MEASPEKSRPLHGERTANPRTRGFLRGFRRDRRAASLVEFALLTPIFLMALGAAVDFGMAVRMKFKLTSALAAASDFTLNNPSWVSSANETLLASTLATLIGSANAANWASSSVNINNGATASTTAGSATVTTGGAMSPAASCYCPTGSGTTFTFGSVVTCGSTCGSGAIASKYVKLTASVTFTPYILPSRLIHSPITASSLIQVVQ
jgi:Flp pilus assembly protein TadG